MSIISPDSWEYIQFFETARHLNDVAGVSFLGTDMSKWPAWAVDVFLTLSQERNRVENARYDAEKKSRKKG